MKKHLVAVAILGSLLLVGLSHAASAQDCSTSNLCITTHGYDNSRDNVNPNESILQARTIGTTGHLLTAVQSPYLNGAIYAQPLYLYGVTIKGTSTNALYVATEENFVYALDEAHFNSTPLLTIDLNNGQYAVLDFNLPNGCANIPPEVGITGTPVIDTSASPDPILYVVSKHQYTDAQGVHIVQRLNAVDASTGSYTSLDIASAFQSNTTISFSASDQNQRAGLGLTHVSGVPYIIVTWGAHCDSGNYAGIVGVFKYTNSTLSFVAAYDDEGTEVNSFNGGIWMAGAAPAIDDLANTSPSGDAFLVSGNGNFSYGSGYYGQSILRLHYPGSSVLTVAGFYTPDGWSIMNNGSGSGCSSPLKLPPPENGTICAPNDLDLGSGGALLARPNSDITLKYNGTAENFVVVAGGKEGVVYVNSPIGMESNNGADPGNPGTAACSTSGSNSAIQCFGATQLPLNCCSDDNIGIRGGAAFWAGAVNGHGNSLYVTGIKDTAIRAYQMDSGHTDGRFVTTSTFGLGNWKGVANTPIPYPGASPVVTWNSGGSYLDAILWLLDESGYQNVNSGTQVAATPVGLYAYAAEPLNGAINLTSFTDTTSGPGATKFSEPTVVNGHVFVAGQKPNAYCSGGAASNQTCYGAVTMWH